MWSTYPKGSIEDVFNLIGGKVQANNFANSCTIKVSRSLNYNGNQIYFIPLNLTVSGKDGKWYIYCVTELIKYLTRKYGKPDLVVKGAFYESKFKRKKGIIVFNVDAWDDASGHASLWNGVSCSDKCYFPLFKKVMLWILE